MAKNIQPEQPPKVSKLPLPVSDSPLVIDLPDGQKIVVGKLAPGSVIEVATWRGVGRPDSRTNRLMLGVGSGNVNTETTTTSDSSIRPVANNSKGWKAFLELCINLGKSAIAFNWPNFFRSFSYRAKVAQGLKRLEKPQDLKVKPEPSNTVGVSDPYADDITAWLNSISKKTEEKISTQVAKPVHTTKKIQKKAAPRTRRR